MSDEAQPGRSSAWIREHPIESAFIALVSLVVIGGLLTSLGGDSATPTTIEASPATTTSAATIERDPDRPDVPQVDCRTLLTDDEVDEALFGEDATGPRGHFTRALGETCRHEPSDDSGRFIAIEPGDPSDFDEQADLAGGSPQLVSNVGDGARWFDDGSELGVLSVGVNLDDSSLIFRIRISDSDLDPSRRLATATELALEALPRFPGTDPGPPAPIVDLCALVSDGQAEAVLAPYRDSHPATRDDVLVTENFSDGVDLSDDGDERCTKLILAEIYIEIQQGSPQDFEPTTRFEGVTGEPVAGIGDEAAWFADVPHQGAFTAPHERGVLAVRVGDATFRLVLAVPDTAAVEQLRVLSELAGLAATAIPGAPVPDSVLVESEPVDLPPADLAEHITTREEAGDWSLGEGLVATLRWLAGEADETQVFEEGEPNDTSAWPAMDLTETFLEANPENDLVPELERLVSLLTPTRAELEAISGPDEPSADAGLLLVSLVTLAQEEDAEEEELQDTEPAEPPSFCETEYGAAEPCLVQVTSPELEDAYPRKYAVFRPRSDLDTGWTQPHVDAAVDAMAQSAKALEPLGSMPPVGIVMANGPETVTSIEDGQCTIRLAAAPPAPNETTQFQQHIARRMAECLLRNGFPFITAWTVGTVDYLSDVIYRDGSLEVDASPKFGYQISNPAYLAGHELNTPVLLRGSTNWALYEYIGSVDGGAEKVIGLHATFPTSIDPYLHDYHLELTDGIIRDVAGTHAYDPPSDTLTVYGATTETFEPGPYQLKRVRIVVQPGKFACINVSASGAVEHSWRAGRPGTPGSWMDRPPDAIEGEWMVVVTGRAGGASVTLEVDDLGDEPDCEEEEGGDITGPILDLCEAICDPSSYYWGPLRF